MNKSQKHIKREGGRERGGGKKKKKKRERESITVGVGVEAEVKCLGKHCNDTIIQ
jgi:hypothetical protein